MPILNFADIADGDSFAGVACVKSMMCRQTRNGNDYITGTCNDQTTERTFKVWDSHLVEYLKSAIVAGFAPTLAELQGSARIYNGKLEYTLNSVFLDAPSIAQQGIMVADFLPSLPYDELWAEMCNFINTKISPNWIQVLTTVLQISSEYFNGGSAIEGTTLNDLMKASYAATKHHDNLRGGLVNHTLKMLRYAEVLVNQSGALWCENKDLIYTGIVLHDIGKIQELGGGAYTKNSFVSHRVMGIEYLALKKQPICELIGVNNYYRLLSIIEGHHDRWATPANTVWAYAIHLIDALDALVTGVNDMNTRGELSVSSSGDAYYPFDKDTNLFV